MLFSRTKAASAALLLTALALAPPAFGFEAEVTATTVAQGYSLHGPWDTSPVVDRRRFLQTLALGVYNLQGDYVPGGPEISVKVRMRLDADFGIDPAETTYSATSTRFVPGLATAPVDLMYGYIEGRNLVHGWLGFRLGRQYVTDSLGWWAFDGGLARVTTPFFVQAEVYGGLEQRGGLPLLATSRFERDGVWRGDRTGFDPGVYPDFQQAQIAPAYGFALESAGVSFVHGRLDYRKVLNTGDSVVAPLADPNAPGATVTGSRTSSERLGYALDASAMKVGGVKGGLVYDLFNGFFSAYYGSADWYALPSLTIGADYDYFRPTFDGDSIFNFFAHSPMRTATGRAAWQITDELDVAASGGIRMFYTEGDPTLYAATLLTGVPPDLSDQRLTDVLGNFSGRYRSRTGSVGVRGLLETGDRGGREGGDLYGQKLFMGGRWMAQARVSVYDWKDNLRPDQSATSFSYVLGGGFRPGQAANVLLEWEHDMNQLVGQRYRVLAVLNLAVGP